MKERFMKNGVFSLEYDKETLRDMVLELQEESQKQKVNMKNTKLYKIKNYLIGLFIEIKILIIYYKY